MNQPRALASVNGFLNLYQEKLEKAASRVRMNLSFYAPTPRDEFARQIARICRVDPDTAEEILNDLLRAKVIRTAGYGWFRVSG